MTGDRSGGRQVQQIFRQSPGAGSIHLLAPGQKAVRGFVLAEGAVRSAAAALPAGAVLAVACASARDLLAGRAGHGAGPWPGDMGAVAALQDWRQSVQALLRLAGSDARVIPVSQAALDRSPDEVLLALHAWRAGAHPMPVVADASRNGEAVAGDLLAELALLASPAAHAVEGRLVQAGLGFAPLAETGALVAGARRLGARLGDLEQQLLERQVELAERDLTEAAAVKLAQDHLLATRAAAEASYADLLARLGEGPMPRRAVERAEMLAGELNALRSSTSWRMTAPLRQLFDCLRRYRMKSEASM